ncbi:MAG: MerR family transcriptional regulator [Erysipelotrichaceae bacterium]|nr:MerR family transcriptional regulator [Erysipelotrichaceae bacterium]
MKVSEFSKRLGISTSKVRYYDRIGLISGEREKNNYRYFSNLDALNIYHAQMLRSFDMSIEESLYAQNQDLSTINNWFELRKIELEKLIRQQELKLFRLNEMQEFFSLINNNTQEIINYTVDNSYNVFNFGNTVNLSKDNIETVKILQEAMPYSYISIKITKESILSNTENLNVLIGLGILERNKNKLNLNLPKTIPPTKGGTKLHILLETENPFNLTKSDIKPLLDKLESSNQYIDGDLIGRVYISYMKYNKFVHGIGLGYLPDDIR